MLEVRQIYEGISLENLSRIFILNPPILARAVFNPKKKMKKIKKKKKKKTKKKKNSRNLKRFFSTSSLVTLTAVAVLERGGLNATLRRVGRTVDLERFPRGCQIEKETWTDVTSGSAKIAPNASTN